MFKLPKRIAGVRIPRRLRKKHGLALIGAGFAAGFLAARKKAAALTR